MERIVKLIAGALLAVTLLGCYAGGRGGGGGAVLATGLIVGAGLGAIAASSQHEHYHHDHHTVTTVYVQQRAAPRPPPRSVPKEDEENARFDPNAVRTALGGVDVTPCNGPPGYGHARVTLNSDGRISRVVVEDPAGLDPAVAQCIGRRLGNVQVAPFSGSLVVVGTSFRMN